MYMGQISINWITTKMTPCVSSYYTETNILDFNSCIFVHRHHLDIIRRRHIRVTQYQWHIDGTTLSDWTASLKLDFNNQCKYWKLWKWLCIMNLTVTLDMSRYNITWWYLLSTLGNDNIKKLEALSYWFHCIEGTNNGGGGVKPQMTLLMWMTWCKKDVRKYT